MPVAKTTNVGLTQCAKKVETQPRKMVMNWGWFMTSGESRASISGFGFSFVQSCSPEHALSWEDVPNQTI
jgi:hypothetical protein